jgi:hypothetical protein
VPLDYEESDKLENLFIWYRARLSGDEAAQRSLQRKYDELKDDLSLAYEQAKAALSKELIDCLPEGDE